MVDSNHPELRATSGAHDRLQPASRASREFVRARRHSRLVRILKIGLPALAALIVVGGIAVTWVARSLPEDFSVVGTSIEDGRIVMEDPRMSGIDSNNRPYELIAERAIQSLGGGGVDLEKITAKIAIDDDTTADILAAAGKYDPTAETLKLDGGVQVDTTSGITISLAAADIDIASGEMKGRGPVRIETPNQTIESSSLNLSDGGAVITFGGRVKMLLRPEPPSQALQQASTSE
ncbi:LPS export ABC transporter periplasmic protein LptC [Aurantimonas sp. A2-1-M11]|uniref:LPS export ABC transporter periplasmic protein LptC n=1 Tax=Aurantimonas sp. A2-1-M11 TaxID=3113712 RepID=UPI002F920D4E